MKYIIKATLSTQHDINAGEKDKDGNPLPVQLESAPTYTVVTNINTSGSVQLTADDIKTSIKAKLNVVNVINESLVRNKIEASGSIDDNYNLFYSATIAQ
jgi:hypothetical protein